MSAFISCYNLLFFNSTRDKDKRHQFRRLHERIYRITITKENTIMTKSFKLISLLAFVILSMPSRADTVLGVYVGAGVWQSEFSGSISETGQLSVDLSNDLGISDEDTNFAFIALEHPIPVIPNIRIQQTDLSIQDTGSLTQSVLYDGITFPVTTGVNSTLDFSHIDATLYYELLDNWVNIDFGMTFRMFDGEASIETVQTPVQTARRELEGTIPMLYLKGQIDLPFTGFYIAASGNTIGYDGNNLTDIVATVGYQSDGLVLDFGIEVGIRKFTFELDDLDEIDGDIEMSGAYAALTIHF